MPQLQEDDGSARDKALMELYPQVWRMAYRATATYGLPPSLDTADLVSSAVIGIAEVWDRYDPKRGPFGAFAVQRAKGAVIEAIRAADWVPRKARERARLKGESVPLVVSIDECRSPGDGDRSLADRLPDPSTPEPGEALLEAEVRTELLRLVDRLSKLDRLIVTKYYFEGVLIRDIARSLGVTPSRVSQIHNRALHTLRAGLEAIDASAAA